MPTPTESLIQKLETFAGTLTDPERDVLGELLLHSMDTSENANEVSGYLSSGPASLLGGSLLSAQAAGKTMTYLNLQTAPGALTMSTVGHINQRLV